MECCRKQGRGLNFLLVFVCFFTEPPRQGVSLQDFESVIMPVESLYIDVGTGTASWLLSPPMASVDLLVVDGGEDDELNNSNYAPPKKSARSVESLDMEANDDDEEDEVDDEREEDEVAPAATPRK